MEIIKQLIINWLIAWAKRQLAKAEKDVAKAKAKLNKHSETTGEWYDE